jgi:hypothetical protein
VSSAGALIPIDAEAREVAHRRALERVRGSFGADPAGPYRALSAEIDTALSQLDCGA